MTQRTVHRAWEELWRARRGLLLNFFMGTVASLLIWEVESRGCPSLVSGFVLMGYTAGCAWAGRQNYKNGSNTLATALLDFCTRTIIPLLLAAHWRCAPSSGIPIQYFHLLREY